MTAGIASEAFLALPSMTDVSAEVSGASAGQARVLSVAVSASASKAILVTLVPAAYEVGCDKQLAGQGALGCLVWQGSS